MPPSVPRPRMTPLAARPLLAAFLIGATLGCAPRARPLAGVEAPRALPTAQLAGAQRLQFRWSYDDGNVVGRGEGVARVVAPDSARLDFFIQGGLGGGGTAFLIGDALDAPGGDFVRRLLPPPALLWASLGRLAVPPATDTVARSDGGLLRADIGRQPVFRVTFEGAALRRVERIDGGRLQEWVARGEGGRVEYVHETSGRRLVLEITSQERVEGFDASIWER